MDEKMKQRAKALAALVRRHYVFFACVIYIFYGGDLIDSFHYGYGESDGERIGESIIVGLTILAGSVLIGSSLLALAILKGSQKE